MANVAKINLLINSCKECPYSECVNMHNRWFCSRDKGGLMVGDGLSVPDFCPFVIERLERAIEVMNKATPGAAPKRWLTKIERLQRDHPDPKFGADHAYKHAMRVNHLGADFLEQCARYEIISAGSEIISAGSVRKWKLLLEISAWLHDVGLADSAKNHAIHSAELARKYLTKNVDIDEEDVNLICHAISNHSAGRETKNVLDAALLLGDKLDVASSRIVRTTDYITAELTKVDTVDFKIWQKAGVPVGAELHYVAKPGFRVDCLKMWPKCILVPRMITLEFLGLEAFKFFVNEEEVDIDMILR